MMPTDTQLLDLLENEGLVLNMWSGEDEGGYQIERLWHGLRGKELIVRGSVNMSLRETLQLAFHKLKGNGEHRRCDDLPCAGHKAL